ncbi:hypothetical protein HID58_067967 [Brassica napus]|uniref:DUF223 domain-containing protein n=2 Tax=Brassica TaxID=3705 RepID=A0A0D3CJC5_BRAOL|nr:PREDICTED: replication protein A 70 kDa DNA-binding subunit D-like [Brassica oleracea var. oleracea]XP_048613509.1 replication protein A 70 kDa DNA-binding subunit B-like [Brassica napus]KAH0880573.1 hypothetical protein HID58_067967 [Brassica napus]CAF1933661.1 unnamed protein product [Brassica napus]
MAGIFDNVIDLNPMKTTWKIKVKIIRLWRQYFAGDIESIEMVLLDSNGDMIHATVNDDVVPIFESFLEEGDSKIFINFSLSQSCGSYRLTKYPYKIWLQATTRVGFCDDLPYRLTGFTPVNFREILDGSLSPEYLIDIIGQIVEVTHVEIVSLSGKDTEKISLELKNEEDVRLPLVVWGKVALDLSEAIQLLSDRTLICVMKFGKIKIWKDERSVCNAYNVSDISLNPSIQEVETFAKLLPKENISLEIVQSKPFSMVSMMSEEEDYFVQTPQKTISDILETRKVERCFVRCTIAAIDNDMGWYYIICKVCGTKLDMLHNNVHPGRTYELDVRCMLYCTKCKMLNPKLKLRYKLHLVVLDNTGHTKLLVLDNIALQLLHQPCFHPTTHITSEILEPNVLRTALKNLVGKTYLFKIIIDEVNYQYEDDTFKVQKIITSPYMMNEFDVSSYPKGGSNMFYPDFSNGPEDPEGSMLLAGGSSVDSESNVKTPAKREGSPIESIEAAFYQSTANKHGPSDSIKKVKTEKSG